MERFHASVEAVRRGEEPPEDGYRGDYIAALAALPGDPVPAMLERIEATLERFRIDFDSWAKQGELERRLPELLPRLDTYEQDGALWARSSAYGDEQDRVLLRSDGRAPTYRAADVAYLEDKLSRGFDRTIYVLGADHHGTRNWYAAVARMLGYDPARVEVLIYQLVHLVEGGEAKRISKRRGDVVFLDDLLDTIGVDAARWYLVSRGHDQTIEIDVDLAAERTQKNPVYYVQYAHARIAGILRNAVGTGGNTQGKNHEERLGVEEPELRVSFVEPTSRLSIEERELVKRLLEVPALAAEAAERRAPHAIPTYAIRVADDFHRFYHNHRVLGSDDEGFRLALCGATAHVVRRCLDLIGVEAPEQM
jgi:arginyl-tRNA synthetase